MWQWKSRLIHLVPTGYVTYVHGHEIGWLYMCKINSQLSASVQQVVLIHRTVANN